MFRTPVCCTFYTSPVDLWLQIRWDGGRQLNNLTQRLTQYAISQQVTNAEGEKNVKFRPHDWVLVRPGDQQLWFRGKILASLSNQHTTVRLIDFGDCASVAGEGAPDCLLPMPEACRHMPPQAVRCKLARLNKPSGWPDREAKLLKSLVTMATEDLILEAEIDWLEFKSEEVPVPVELYQCNGHSINDIFGQRTGSLIRHRTAGCFINSWGVTLKTTETPPDLSWDPFECRVSHVTNSGRVFVQENLKQLEGLQDQLQLLYDSEDLQRFSPGLHPERDEIFAVFQGESGYHYRGRVLEQLGQQVKVLIIDFGFELTVNWDQCARIPRRIRYKPQCRVLVPTSLNRLPSGASLGSLWNSERAAPAKAARASVTPNRAASGPEVQAAYIVLKLGDGRQADIVDFLLENRIIGTAASYRPCQAEINWDVDNIVCGKCTHVVDRNNHARGHVFLQPDCMQDTLDQVTTLITELCSPSRLSKPTLDQLRKAGPERALAILAEASSMAAGNRRSRSLFRGSADSFDEATMTCDLTDVDTGERFTGFPMDKIYSAPDEIASLLTTCVKCQLQVNGPDGQAATLSPGDTGLFSIVGIADGAYQIRVLSNPVAARV